MDVVVYQHRERDARHLPLSHCRGLIDAEAGAVMLSVTNGEDIGRSLVAVVDGLLRADRSVRLLELRKGTWSAWPEHETRLVDLVGDDKYWLGDVAQVYRGREDTVIVKPEADGSMFEVIVVGSAAQDRAARLAVALARAAAEAGHDVALDREAD